MYAIKYQCLNETHTFFVSFFLFLSLRNLKRASSGIQLLFRLIISKCVTPNQLRRWISSVDQSDDLCLSMTSCVALSRLVIVSHRSAKRDVHIPSHHDRSHTLRALDPTALSLSISLLTVVLFALLPMRND